jgi:hypothetical protein
MEYFVNGRRVAGMMLVLRSVELIELAQLGAVGQLHLVKPVYKLVSLHLSLS